ncbi:NAD(P)/FAD-dependent oxidoreductase [Bdellovibrio bacteriovorus]|uniref:protoporphyrinogen/coproporphyrinogen oxidase n=1 Tax=Bdellovibrio bacteriovorus TaxID=959 RepID=UPI0035A744FC
MKNVSVIGAGFAGLTVSLELAQKGFQVDLYESSSRVGGLLGTDYTEYGIAERAANALIRTTKANDLFARLGLTPSFPLESSKKRFLFRDHPRSWPLSFSESLSLLARVVPRLLLGKRHLRPRPQETLEAWGKRLLGPKATRFILGPAMQGIYGNDISGLSASLILGPLFRRKKKDKYRGLLTSRGGMQDLVDALEKALRDKGVRIHLNTAPDLASLTGPVVIATSAKAASALTLSKHPELSQVLGKIRMSSLMSVTLFFNKAQTSYQGFGCLIPRGYNLKALGVLMNSYIFKDRNKHYNETWIMGGYEESSLLDLPDRDVLKLIAEERFKILGHKESLLDYRINRWKDALPYYDLQLEEVSSLLMSQNLPSGVYLHGNYLSGIGLSKILERSEVLAEQIAGTHG